MQRNKEEVSWESIHVDPIIKMQRYGTFEERTNHLADKNGIITFFQSLRTGKRSMRLEDVVSCPDEMVIFQMNTNSNLYGMAMIPVGDEIYLKRLKVPTKRVPEGTIISKTEVFCNYEARSNSKLLVSKDGIYPLGNDNVVYENDNHFLQNDAAIKKMLKEVGIPFVKAIKGNEVVKATSVSSLKKLFTYIPPQKKANNTQKVIDFLMSKEAALPDKQKTDVLITFMDIVKINGPFEPVLKAKNVCAIRTFYQMPKEDPVEIARVFVIDKNKTMACKIEDGEGFPMAMSDRAEHWNFPVIGFDKDNLIGTKLEYMGDVLENMEPEDAGILAYMFLKSPIFELMSKNGMMGFVKSAIKQFGKMGGSIKELISCSLGIEATASNLKEVGFSAPQLKYLTKYSNLAVYRPWAKNEWAKGFFLFLRDLYEGCSGQKINTLDQRSFERLADMLAEVWEASDKSSDSSNDDFINFFKDSFHNWGLANILVFYETHKERIISNNQITISASLVDYVSMVKKTGTSRDFKLKYKDKDELRTKHNNVMVVYELRKDEIRRQEIEKALEEERGYEYDDKKSPWVVIAPKETEEIIQEGLVLNHCVASYCEKVINRDTNILFIRNRENVSVPFFTMEVTKYGDIRQVHGVNNDCVRTVEGLRAFVDKYAKKKKFKILDIDKRL